MRKFLILVIILFVACSMQETKQGEKGLIFKSEKEVAAPALTKRDKKIGTYELVSNPYNDQMCVDFLNNLKEFEDQEFMLCDLKTSSKYPKLKNLDWREVDVEKSEEVLRKAISAELVSMSDERVDSRMLLLREGKLIPLAAKINNLVPSQENMILGVKWFQCVDNSSWSNYVLDEDGKYIETKVSNFQGRGGEIFQYGQNYINVYSIFYGKINEGRIQVNKIRYRDGLYTGQHPCQYKWTRVKK